MKPMMPHLNLNFEWPFPDFRQPQKFWKLRSKYTCLSAGLAGKVLLSWMNSTKIYNRSTIVDAIYKRPKGTPLITVANHESCIDDPMLIGYFLTAKQLADQKNMRWNLAAHDICYTRPLHGLFFSHGKCAPVVRGLGVYQKSLDFIIERLNEDGDWLHIFPEGKINMERKQLHRLKWGVGRIISECKKTPLVLPFWHTGLADILPNYPPYYPRIGKKAVINVGELLNIEPVINSVENKTAVEKRKVITDFIQQEMEKLRTSTLKLAGSV